MRVAELTRDAQPQLFDFFAALATGGGETDLDSDASVVSAMVELGFLVTAAQIVAHPRYAVALPRPGEPERGSDWVVAPSYRYQSGFAPHPDVAWPVDYDEQESRLAVFAPGPAIWVGEPDALTSPYWVDPADAAQLARLAPGDPAQQVVVVPGFLPADELAAVNTYYAAQLDAGLLPFGDRQNGRRFSLYDDPLGRSCTSGTRPPSPPWPGSRCARRSATTSPTWPEPN